MAIQETLEQSLHDVSTSQEILYKSSSKAQSITLPGSTNYKKNAPSHPWPSSSPAMQSVCTPASQLVLPSMNFSTSLHTSSKPSPSSCKTTFSSSQTHTGNSCLGLKWALPPHACGQHCSSTLMKNFCTPPTPSSYSTGPTTSMTALESGIGPKHQNASLHSSLSWNASSSIISGER